MTKLMSGTKLISFITILNNVIDSQVHIIDLVIIKSLKSNLNRYCIVYGKFIDEITHCFGTKYD